MRRLCFKGLLCYLNLQAKQYYFTNWLPSQTTLTQLPNKQTKYMYINHPIRPHHLNGQSSIATA